MSATLLTTVRWSLALCWLLVLATPGRAAWPSNPVVNLPIARAAGNQNTSAIVTDGAGGAYVAWTDSRSGARDIYAHRILATGLVDPAWPLDGLAVCTASGDQTNAALVSDGLGGALLSWQDNRNGAPDIFAHRLTRTGLPVTGWPTNGIAVCTAADSQFTPAAAGDGLGGVFIVWQDRRGGLSTDLFVHHLQAAGTLDPGWPAQGLALCTAAGRQDRPRIIADLFGGAIIAWSDPRGGAGTDDIRAGRLLASGSTPPGWPFDGLLVCGAGGAQTFPVLVTDGTGGAIVTWSDERGGSANDDIYAQRVLAGGTVDGGWPPNGLAICTATGSQVSPAIVEDGNHGAIIAWADGRGANGDVYAQRVRAPGTVDPAWPTDGRALCTAPNDQALLAAVADGSGGALVAWTDFRNGSTNADIFGQHVTQGGAVDPLWPQDGVALSSAAANQITPKPIQDGAGGMIATWTDSRNGGTNTDIYGQRVQANGQLGEDVVGVIPMEVGLLRLGPVSPSPVRGGRFTLHYSLPGPLPARLEIMDIAGRRTTIRESIGGHAGPGSIELGAAPPMKPGVYLLRLTQGVVSTAMRAVVIE